MAKIHIGRKIQEVAGQSGHNITEFASLINKSRTVAYDIFKRDTIDTGLLEKISQVLKHDFFSYYSKQFSSSVKEDKVTYVTPPEMMKEMMDEIRAMRKDITELHKKYDELKGKIEKKRPYIKRKKKEG